ncbi:MAG: HAD-IA family hydrolase [Planctomycetota bacterium]|nr:HAD-IA family hydrolase [Planctomycetota bacterium]
MTGALENGIRFVYFDCGGTLLTVRPSVGSIYSLRAAAHGFSVEADLLDERFRQAWNDSKERARQRNYVCSDEVLRGEWLRIVTDTFGEAIAEEEIGPVFADLYEYFVAPSAWTLDPAIRPLLGRLRGQGLGLGILSNWDRRLRRTLEQLELLEFFDQVVISNEVGWEKPHREIFELAIEKSGCGAENILHVGDSMEADILPATELGLAALWVDRQGFRQQPPGGVFRCEDPGELTESEWDNLLKSYK